MLHLVRAGREDAPDARRLPWLRPHPVGDRLSASRRLLECTGDDQGDGHAAADARQRSRRRREAVLRSTIGRTRILSFEPHEGMSCPVRLSFWRAWLYVASLPDSSDRFSSDTYRTVRKRSERSPACTLSFLLLPTLRDLVEIG